MGEEGGVYHAARLRRDSRVEADDIAGRKQFPEREIGYGKGLFRFRIFSMGGIIKKLASEGGQPLRRGLCDVPKADQADFAIPQLCDPLDHGLFLHLDLTAFPDGAVARDPPAQQGQHQKNCLLCHGARIAALIVADENTAFPCRLDINAVECHALRMDHFELWHSPDQVAVYRADRIHQKNLRVRAEGEPLLIGAAEWAEGE